MSIELVWFRGAAQKQGVYLFSSTAISIHSGRVGDWWQYRLPRAMGSCIFNEDGYHQGYLHNLHPDADQYDTIHEFTVATYPGIEPYHAWVGYSNWYRTQDNLAHAVEWYIQHPAEYLSCWYQHYVLTDIAQPQQYWQSSVSKHIGTKFFEDADDEPALVLEATVFRVQDTFATVWH